jgi:hypothetical protein
MAVLVLLEGCQGITAYVNVDDGRTLVVVQHWTSKEAHQRYMAWRRETGVQSQVASMWDSPRCQVCICLHGINLGTLLPSLFTRPGHKSNLWRYSMEPCCRSGFSRHRAA